ncbi:MAG: hypothetical protein A2234_07755 [Elusimicrobia bacterium RIFOXYA2_FULL_58_8]|nr:MAG: hypothetical protein A2285_09195 [Elusimicrobia bacterium RIFOXYA12_FULL_57_11]OGS12349.1 MAG: hypothetical protein A2234_07755 [Elusimicrobia bacterium RIFOXYA2_FULL_58_8]
MRVKPVIFALAAVFCGGGTAFAAYPLVTDDAGTVQLNSYELEASYDTFKDETDARPENLGVSFKHGITDRFDIGFSLPCRLHPGVVERVGAASLGLKFSLVKDLLAFSVINELGKKEYFLNGILSKEFGPLKTHLNAGYLSTGEDNRKGLASCGLAAEYPLKNHEAVAELKSEEGGTGFFLLGLRYGLKEAFFISAGAARSLEADRYRFTGGFHVEF